jgi:hypothetical protein
MPLFEGTEPEVEEVIERDTVGIQIMKLQPKLNGRSRCGKNGKLVGFTCCGKIFPVYHLSFSGLWCSTCEHEVRKEDITDLGNHKHG